MDTTARKIVLYRDSTKTVVMHANKGLGPVWDKPLSRLEMDAASHADAVSRAVADYLKTGVHPPELDLGSVYKPGATF